MEERNAWLRTGIYLLVGLALLVALNVQSAGAIPVLDQHQSSDPSAPFNYAIGGSSQQKLAQVVTAGMSGILSEVGLAVGGGPSLAVVIEGIVGGKPNGVVLTSETIPSVAFSGDFVIVHFSAPVAFSKGEQFAIVLNTSGAWSTLPGPVGNPYAGGDAFFDARPNLPGWVLIGPDRFDLPFETFVDVPEPSTLLLLCYGLAALAGVRWSASIARRTSSRSRPALRARVSMPST